MAEQADGRVLALTDTGAFHIDRLHLDRPHLVAYRYERRRLEATRQTQRRLLERLQQLQDQVQALMTQLEKLTRNDDG